MKRNILWGLLLILICSCSEQPLIVKYDNPEIYYEGRILYEDSAAELMWSGTSVTLQFEGKDVYAILRDEDTSNYYNVIVDGEVVNKIHTTPQKARYLLAGNMDKGAHSVQLFKRTEWDKGKSYFYGFELSENGKLLSKAELKKRKIEFYGNSITCGYGNEDLTGKDRSIGACQNNYETYAAITARHFNARYHCIAKSGIGILLSWFPLIMPEMYNRTDPTDSNSVWDFSQYIPDIVVINLFQNDSWLVNRPDHEEFIHRLGDEAPDATVIVEAYKEFVKNIRKQYPQSSIICALGSMDATRDGSLWPHYVQEAVKQLDDEKIYTCMFPYKNTPGHPKVAEHHVMADTLIRFIEENIEW